MPSRSSWGVAVWHGVRPPKVPHAPSLSSPSVGLSQGCIGREGTEAAPPAVRQAVGGGCRSGWGGDYCRLQMPLKRALTDRRTVAGRPGGGYPPFPMYPRGRYHCRSVYYPPPKLCPPPPHGGSKRLGAETGNSTIRPPEAVFPSHPLLPPDPSAQAADAARPPRNAPRVQLAQMQTATY